VIMPFVDMNGNDRYDKGEPKVLGLRININGGRVEQSKRDSVIRIFDLEPYVSYFIEFDRFSFDNIAWQMHLKNMNVTVDPDQFKLVEIPISVMGEGSGKVNMSRKGKENGFGRIIVDFYNSNGIFFAKTLTEFDGYFNFLGLPPGSYLASVDTAQMHKLDMSAKPDSIAFTIKRSLEGDVKDGMEFVIKSNHIVTEVPKETEPVKKTIDEQPKADRKRNR